jgi:hypothetical protein
LCAEWDAKCPGLDAARIWEAEWQAKELHNYEQFSHDEQHESDDDDSGWGIPKDDSHWV